ncbi:protein phtf isoform X2 [Venturia canescens]|nr:protein phtf isoform X2 [Venturia canescens]
MPVGMMFVLCLVHSQIVSTNSSSAAPTSRKTSRMRRSRHERCRSGKLRTRRNLRSNIDSKSCQDGGMKGATERAKKMQCSDVSPFVRFAQRVNVENPPATGKVQLEDRSAPFEVRLPECSPELPLSRPIETETSTDEAGVENMGNADTVHQDDDGFESLNGNVSSDNDRVSVARREEPSLRGSSNHDNVDGDRNSNHGDEDNDVDNVIITGDSEREVDHKIKHDTANFLDAFYEEQANRSTTEREQKNHDWRASPSVISATENAPVVETESYSREHDFLEAASGSTSAVKTAVTMGKSDKMISREEKRECESEEEGECEEATMHHLTEATTSATEWMGVTSNSDVCSYSSDFEQSESGHSEGNCNYADDLLEHPFFWELELPSSIPLGSSCCTSSDRVSCTIWTRRDIKKVELSVLDISSAIIARVESMPEGMDYVYGGLLMSLVLSLIPSIKRLSDEFGTESSNNLTGSSGTNIREIALDMSLENWSKRLCATIDVAFGSTLWERTVVLTLAFEKLALSCLLFFLLAVAERTFKQRLLYAKLFSHLTSSRRARKSDLPHFRLNKFRNIKTWLSVRAYLKRRGPQRSVDVIVSAVFIVTLLLLSFVSLELIRDLENLHSRYNVEALLWSFALGIYILRFMTLGTKINKKYRNLSILITEQINLYLQMEQKPHKKDELMVANSVLKLAADLIKELECPFKISGLSANPYLYTITKVVLLSALSGVLSELLGFKLKLHKITIK